MYHEELLRRDPVHAMPMTFTALMDMYEQNYLMLRVLCGDIPDYPAKVVSRVSGKAQDLHLFMIESTPHTVTLKLTYLFPNHELKPDLMVRIYKDAQQAEVLSRKCRVTGKNLKVDSGVSDTALYCRWQLNRFLYKWLRYCKRQGHSFQDLEWSPLNP